MTFEQFCSQCLESANGDLRAAEEIAQKALRESRDWEADFGEELIAFALHERLSKCMHDVRARICSRPVATETHEQWAQEKSARRQATEDVARMYGYPLEGGLKLAEARREDLIRQAELHEKLARSNTTKAVWMRSIAACLPNDSVRVRDAIDPRKLEELLHEAEGA